MQTIASKNIIILNNGSVKQIIGFTDSETECECCGKKDLKGTYCLDIDGIELYYGSVCAFKNHGITMEAQKEAKANFTKEQKKKAALLELKNMAITAKGSDYEEKKVLSFIKKKGLDLLSFLASQVSVFEENNFYVAYSYGAKVHIFDK